MIISIVPAGLIATAPHALGSILLQGQDVITSGHALWLEVFIGVAAIALLTQALVVVGVAIGLYVAQKNIMKHVHEIKGKALPLIDKSTVLIGELTPEIKAITLKVKEIAAKVDVITAHAEVISGLAQEKAREFSPTLTAANQTVREANEKTRQQVQRVNEMVTGTLDATARLGKAIERGISIPGRELAGVVAGAKAAADHLMHHDSALRSFVGRFSSLFGGQPTSPSDAPRSYTPPTQAYRSLGVLPPAAERIPPVHVPPSNKYDQ
jgi:hypothetical protein